MNYEKRRLIIRADASRTTGFGHLVRSCAMAGYMSHDFECLICTWDSTGTPLTSWARHQAEDAGAGIVALCGASRNEADDEFLRLLEAEEETPLTVLDNYYYGPEYQRQVRERSRALICLDDMHDRHFIADILISFVPLDRSRFSMEPYTRFLSGFEWSFLRAPFLRPIPRNSKRHSIMIAMGGADPLELTGKVARGVREALPDATIEIVAGNSVRLDSSIDMMPRTVVHRNLDATEMADLFDRSMLGIFPASTICVEAFARRVRVGAGYFTDNQVDFYHEGVKRGLFIPLGDLRADSTDWNILRDTGWQENTEMPDFINARNRLITLFRDL